MVDMLGILLWLAALPPVVAVAGVILWRTRPQLRRNEGYRLALIASVSLTAIEAIIAGLFLFMLIVFSRSGGMDNF